MIDKAKMSQHLERARTINERVDKLSPKASSKGMPTLSESMRIEGVSDIDYQPYEFEYTENQNTGRINTNSKIPTDIMESIRLNPIQEYSNGVRGLSVLDDIPLPTNKRRINENVDFNDFNEKQIPTTEELFRNRSQQPTYQPQPTYQQQPTYQPQPTYQQAPAVVDYSLISSIVKAAVAEEMVKLRKTIINESKQNGGGDVVIKIGSNIRFMTNNGNVYEGKLKLIGNTLTK